MRPDPAGKDCVAVDDEMMRSDRRGEVGSAGGDVIRRLFGRDVLQHDA